MDDHVAVAVLHAGDDLLEEAPRLVLHQAPLLHYVVEQLARLQQRQNRLHLQTLHGGPPLEGYMLTMNATNACGMRRATACLQRALTNSMTT